MKLAVILLIGLCAMIYAEETIFVSEEKSGSLEEVMGEIEYPVPEDELQLPELLRRQCDDAICNASCRYQGFRAGWCRRSSCKKICKCRCAGKQ